MDEGKIGLLDKLKKAIEICMPNFRHYYRITKKAKIVATYPSKDGKYYADVQALRNDESVDKNEPVVAKIAIPVLWAGKNRGVVCPPQIGTFCDLSYYDGDPNYPYISNFRWHDMDAPEAELDEFVIQLEKGVEIRIDKEKQIVALTPSNYIVKVDGDAKINTGGNVQITAKGNVEVKAQGNVDVKAQGNVDVEAQGKISLRSQVDIALIAPTIGLMGLLRVTDMDGNPGSGVLHGTYTIKTGSFHVPDAKITTPLVEAKDVKANDVVAKDVKAGAVDLRAHKHSGVMPGSATTQKPVGG